jgi:hypothetical protein
VELLIGRLVTDETFRTAFVTDAAATLAGFMDAGYELTSLELAALRATRVEVWTQAAEHLDPRLLKTSLTPSRTTQTELSERASKGD